MNIAGVAIRTSHSLVIRVAYPRSAARAKRRAKLGHPQHYVTRPDPKVYQTPQGFFMHPSVLEDMLKDPRLRRQVRA